jgi:hypothetical protein
MKRLYSLMLIALCCAGVALADEATTRVITIKHGNMIQIVHTIGPLLPGTGVAISNDGERLVLRGPKDTVTGLEEIIKQLDVPPAVKRNVETTVYMVVASSQAGNAPMPAELDPVVKQLKGLFSYKGYRLMDSFVLRSRDGERGDTSGFVPPADASVAPGHKIIYQFQFNHVRVDGGDTGRVIRFDGLKMGTKVPVAGQMGAVSYVETGISTDVDVPEGKKVVVGKTSAVEGSDSALILVISAKVVD